MKGYGKLCQNMVSFLVFHFVSGHLGVLQNVIEHPFLFVTSLRLHMFEKHGDDEVKCQECPMKFNHPVALERHVALRHTNTICPECGEEVGVARLKTHMRSKHTLESQKVVSNFLLS